MTLFRATCLWVASFLFGCAGENSLSGSISELFPLTVSKVDVHRNTEALQITYFNNKGADVDIVLRVAVSLDGIDLQPGDTIALEGEYSPGHPRTSVAHQGGGEPEHVFGTIRRGQLHLDEGGAPGERTRGSFGMLFETGDAYGAGRDVSGTFTQVAVDAGFDPPPL